MDRIDGRAGDQLRPVGFDLGIAPHADGYDEGDLKGYCAVFSDEAMIARFVVDESRTSRLAVSWRSTADD